MPPLFAHRSLRLRHIGMTFAAALLAISGAFGVAPTSLHAQEVRVRDLTIVEGAVPVRIVGYGIVVGLDGTGDRGVGGKNGGQTVQSIANLLRKFDVEIPAEALRTRNAAAVLVTAEVSPYLRPGGRFEVNIASLGDARSLRGGTLWMTPLITDAGTAAVGTAQGSIVMSDGNLNSRDVNPIETSGRIPTGGILEGPLPRGADFGTASRILLKEPDISTAIKIVAAINQAIGANTAKVDDPGSISLTIADATKRAETIVRIGELKVTPDRENRLVIDGRDGTVVVGGDITVSSAVVSHGGVTLTIGGDAGTSTSSSNKTGDGETRGTQSVAIQSGASVQKIAAALQAVQVTPSEIAAIFTSLREVGAIAADIKIR